MGRVIRPAVRTHGWSWAAALLGTGLLFGCNALLGVEDLQPAKDAGSDASPDADGGGHGGSGSAGHGGRAEPQAGSSGSGAAGDGETSDSGSGGHAAGSGGNTSGGTGGHAGQNSSGSGGHAGTTAAGTGGAGGSGTSTTVHGQVLDYFHHTVAGVMVEIGGKSASTDSSGAFSIDAVAATYDVLLTVNANVNNVDTRISWQVQGLTRRDPTLQVYRGLNDRFGSVLMHVTNVTFPLATDQKITMGWSGPDGDFSDDLDSADTDYLPPRWVGPAMTLGTAHALRFSYSGAQDLPTDYLAHDSKAVGITETVDPGGEVTFDLGGATKPATGAVSGSVTGAVANDRANQVYVRFTDTTAILLADDTAATGSFSYIVPNLSNAVIDVVAKNQQNEAYAAALLDNVAPNQAGLALNIPTIPTLTAPADGKTNVDETTLFQWQGDAKVFLFCAYSDYNFDALCVVTSQKQTHLPAPPTSAGKNYYWTIETHDDFATVDAASGPDGYLSSYAYGSVRGPKRGNTTYAESASRLITSTP